MVFAYLKKGWFYTFNESHYFERDPLLRGYYTSYQMNFLTLHQFSQSNQTALQNLKLSKDYQFPLAVGQKQPVTLFDLCSYGLSNMDCTAIAAKYLMDELLLINE
jgi:hypothetical protein